MDIIMTTTMLTKDGWVYAEIYAANEGNPGMIVYKVTPPTSSAGDKYFVVTTGRYRETFVKTHTAKEMLDRLMPQHYECKCDSELLAVTIARNVAYKSIVSMYQFQMNKIEESFKRLHDQTHEMLKNLEDNYPAALSTFWNDQDTTV